jgi:hypothetical protein
MIDMSYSRIDRHDVKRKNIVRMRSSITIHTMVLRIPARWPTLDIAICSTRVSRRDHETSNSEGLTRKKRNIQMPIVKLT